jgi:glycosyltransferase involved in cell wall biosynthesis
MSAVLFVNPTPPDDPAAGGITTYIAHRAETLSARGVTAWWGSGERFARYDGPAHRWIPAPAPPAGRMRRAAGRFWLPASPLWAFCEREAIPAIEMADGATVRWPDAKPFRIGIQCHNSQHVRAFINRDRLGVRMALFRKEQAVRRALEHADGVLACSHEIAYLTSGFYRLNPDRFAVLPHAFSRRVFGGGPEGGARHDHFFLMAGNIEYVKGFDLVAEGFRRYRKKGGKALWVVAGTDGWADRNPQVKHMLAGQAFAELIAQEGRECVRFLGVLDKTALAGWRARATACVIGSRFDSFTMVAGEAFLSHAPLILSARTGWRGLAERFGAARLVDPYEPDDLAAAFAELEDPAVRTAYQEKGDALAGYLTGPELAAQTVRWYENLAAGTLRQGPWRFAP